jgi:hypothetical protein
MSEFEQFEALIADLRKLADDLLRTKNPQRAKHVKQQVLYMEITVRQNPAAAKAVLYCASAMWHLLLEDAGAGARQRHVGLDGPLPHQRATKELLIAAIDDYCRNHPGAKITQARRQVAADFGYSDPQRSGQKNVASKTGFHNPLKILG